MGSYITGYLSYTHYIFLYNFLFIHILSYISITMFILYICLSYMIIFISWSYLILTDLTLFIFLSSYSLFQYHSYHCLLVFYHFYISYVIEYTFIDHSFWFNTLSLTYYTTFYCCFWLFFISTCCKMTMHAYL